MLNRSQRFSFRTGAPKLKIITPLFMVRYQLSETEPKYAVVVPKKVSKKAVQRNRVKRIFIQTLQEFLANNKNGYDLVFFLRLPYTEYKKSVIMQSLRDLHLFTE
jgi:ribonuclease P protein component